MSRDAAAAAAAALARPDAPVRRGSLADSILGVAAGFGGAIARVGGAAAAVITDADLRRQGLKNVAGAASAVGRGVGRAAATAASGPARAQALLARLAARVEEQRRAQLLAEQRDHPVDVQVGPQLFEEAPQELRSRLWLALLQRPELCARYQAMCAAAEARRASPPPPSPPPVRTASAGASASAGGAGAGAAPAEWDLVPEGSASRQRQGAPLLAGGADGRRSPWPEGADDFKRALAAAMAEAPWPPSAAPPAEGRYATLLQISVGEEEVETAIARDIARTFPEFPQFGDAGGEGQGALFRVLKAYSLADLEVNYCQGMAFVAGVILFFVPEHEAFLLLCRLFDEAGAGLRRLYLPGLEGLKAALRAFEALLARRLPNLAAHLAARGAAPVLYAAQWWLTAFSCPFPVGFSARLLDVALAEGSGAVFHRAALAVMAEAEGELLVRDDFEALLTYLKVEPGAWPTARLRRVLNAALASPVGDAELAEAEAEAEADPEPMGLGGIAGASPGSAAAAGLGALEGVDGAALAQLGAEGSAPRAPVAAGAAGAAADDKDAESALELEYSALVADLERAWSPGSEDGAGKEAGKEAAGDTAPAERP